MTQFLICPIPKDHMEGLDPDLLFYSPAGTPFYYNVEFLNDATISIFDTVGRSVKFVVEDTPILLDALVSPLIKAQETIIIENGQDSLGVPFDQEELPSLVFILERIVSYTTSMKLAGVYFQSILVSGAEA